MKTIRIADDPSTASIGAIEVTVEFNNGEKRWCFFFTPEGLSNCGDYLGARKDVRIHLGVPHMIVLSKVDRAIIETAINELDRTGKLYSHTMAIQQKPGRRD